MESSRLEFGLFNKYTAPRTNLHNKRRWELILNLVATIALVLKSHNPVAWITEPTMDSIKSVRD